MVPGCGTSSSQPADIESAVRYAIEVAKAFGEGKCSFYNEEEYRLCVEDTAKWKQLQGNGSTAGGRCRRLTCDEHSGDPHSRGRQTPHRSGDSLPSPS